MKHTFNTNSTVQVRLNAKGWAILRAEHAELQRLYPKVSDFQGPKTDAEGWSTYQLWSLMHDFGQHLVLGMEPPFDTTVRFDSADLHPVSTGMTPAQIIAEFQKGCSNTVGGKAHDCPECVAGMLKALQVALTSAIDLGYSRINALGGTVAPHNEDGAGYVRAIDEALKILTDLGAKEAPYAALLADAEKA